MDLKQLQALGAIVPRGLIKREITFDYYPLKPETEWAESDVPERQDDKTEGRMTVHIRKGSSADAIEVAGSSERERPFVAILRCICNENGDPVFPTIEDAMSLETWLAIPLFEAINSVSGIGTKKSQPGTSSGAKSRSLSAGDQSRNGKRSSRTRKKVSGDSTVPSVAH
ncbi:MAG: phage tail assembly chaperone family protein, TAC [Pseudomonadota bacterium]|nr:phage tail assembly chaperone family protein, TAC [Pseudomonadota bacterium]